MRGQDIAGFAKARYDKYSIVTSRLIRFAPVIPIVQLIPVRKRKVSAKGFAKLKANIEAIGLIDPLCVCQDASGRS